MSLAYDVPYESYPPSLWAPPAPIDPHITSLVPNTGTVGTEAVVQVNGTDFDDTAEVEVDQGAGQALVPSVYVSPTEVTATFTPTTAGEALFTVRNQSNDEESNPMPFTIEAAEEPAGPAKGSAAPGDVFSPESSIIGQTATQAAKLEGLGYVAAPQEAWLEGESITVNGYSFHWDGAGWAPGAVPAPG